MQQLVDKALGFDRKKFNEIEEKLKTIADNKKLTPEERAEQSKPLNEQREAMLKEAMDRLTGKKSSSKDEAKQPDPAAVLRFTRSAPMGQCRPPMGKLLPPLLTSPPHRRTMSAH